MTETTIRGHKGMTSVKELPVLQDGPPPGGFPAVRYARRIANTGPSGVTVLLVSSAVIGWGMYQVGQGNIYRRGLKAEKIAARQAIVPLIQAEEDVRFVREKNKLLDEEAKVMANVPDWKDSVMLNAKKDVRSAGVEDHDRSDGILSGAYVSHFSTVPGLELNMDSGTL